MIKEKQRELKIIIKGKLHIKIPFHIEKGNKKKKNKMIKFRITKEMEEKVLAWRQYLDEKCITTTGFTNPQFFFGAGILKKPISHIHKNVNEIYALVVGLNNKGTAIKKMVDLSMTIQEAMMLEEMFKEIIRRYHLYRQKEILDEMTDTSNG